MNWIQQHLAFLAVAGPLVTLLLAKLPALLEKDLAAELAKLEVRVTNPKALKVISALDDYIEDIVPNAGDQRYLWAAQRLLHPFPILTPLQPLLVALLTALCEGAQAAAADDRKELELKLAKIAQESPESAPEAAAAAQAPQGAPEAATAVAGPSGAAKVVLLALLGAAAIFGAQSAQAAGGTVNTPLQTPAQNTTAVFRSSETCAPVTLSTMSVTPVMVLGSTTTYAWSWVRVDNMEASANEFFNENPSVSTSTTAGIPGAGPRGEKVAAAGSQSWTLKPGTPWYGICDKTGATASCDLEVCKGF